jgi:SAM-dependent methyltransferase
MEVRGVDRSQEQVDAAREAGLPCELGDGLLALGQHRSDLDLVTAFDLIEHLSKDEVMDFLSAAHEALVPGGLLILKCPNCTTPFGIGIRYGDFTHEVGLTTGSMAHLLRLSGFQAVEFRETGPYPHGLKSAIRTVAWKVLRGALIAWDYIETGGSESSVRTRVMLVRARKIGAKHEAL